jgi:1,4-alpha-glucan branching enzyme
MKKQLFTFKFHAPDARSVHLAGNFNSWDTSSHPLSQVKTSNGNGMWKRTVRLKPGVYEYRFIVDGIWHDDEGSVDGWTNEFGTFNCVIWA